MFAGHFGLAAAVKAKNPETPLWARYSAVSIAIEAALIVGGFILYVRSILKQSGQTAKGLAFATIGVMGISLVLALITDVAGI